STSKTPSYTKSVSWHHHHPGDVYTKALDATTKSAVYDFKASYVRAVADQTATAGYVKTNTAYTITYQ
uniref:hypothetical protein n=1 Tax=Escherichia coli TaxID=562 RepID=UPI001CDAA170